MIRYRVTVSTPYHGELFEARCTSETIAMVLEAATRAVQTIERELVEGRLPVHFEVQVIA